MKKKGYFTGCIGKWHLGLGFAGIDSSEQLDTKFVDISVDFTKPLTAGPHTIGFDYSYIIPASLDIPPYCYIENGCVLDLPMRDLSSSPRPAFWRAGKASLNFSHQKCLLNFTERAVKFIEEAKEPFFLFFATPSPHTPHIPRKEFVGKSCVGVYGDLVVETDWSIGQIMMALKRRDVEENTLFIVTSDNGAHTKGKDFDFEKEYGHKSNYIYRGQKTDIWEGGHRVPFIAHWPAEIPSSTRYDGIICLNDLLATCAAFLEIELPDNTAEDSFNILPAFQDNEPVRQTVIFHSATGKFAISDGVWKFIDCSGSGGWSLPDDEVSEYMSPCQLYNIKADPEEKYNLISCYPEIASRLKQLLEEQKLSNMTRRICN